MIQYNGITLIKDSDGTPAQIHIDLHMHGAELAGFLRSHGLGAKEQADLARSLDATGLVPGYIGAEGSPVRYLPEVRRELSDALSRACDMRRVDPLFRTRLPMALVGRMERAFQPLPRRREATPGTLSARYGRDTFWTRFNLQGLAGITWCVFYTVHDEGVVLVRHFTAAVEEDEL